MNITDTVWHWQWKEVLSEAKKVKGEHIRVHPLLNWTEKDIWEYITEEQLEIIDLYYAQNGERYRSVGCECCSYAIKSDAKNNDDVAPCNELELLSIIFC